MTLIELLLRHDDPRLTRIRFSKGETLFQEGERCEGVCVVLEGRIKIVSYSMSGTEIVYNLIGPGGIFGNNLAFASDSAYRGNVIAFGDGELIYLPKAKLKTLLRQDEEFLEEYLRLQSDFGKSLNAKMKILSFPSAADRLDYYLAIHQGHVEFDSVSALADSLFLSREALSRLIHQWEREGKLKIGKGRIDRIA